MDQNVLDEAVISFFSGPEWETIKKGLEHDIYNIQASMLDVNSWDEVNQLKGFCRGIAYVINLRDSIKAARDSENAEV